MPKEGALTGQLSFPAQHEVEEDGWKLMIECSGSFTGFIYTVAQAGDPKGRRVVLTGPNRERVVIRASILSLFSDYDALNLRNERSFVLQLAAKLKDKYRREPNYAFLHKICEKGFKPYGYGG